MLAREGVAASWLIHRHGRPPWFPLNHRSLMVSRPPTFGLTPRKLEAWLSNVLFLFSPSGKDVQTAVGPPSVKMEGWHTWPKEKTSWRAVCQAWLLAPGLQQSGSKKKEGEIDQGAIQEGDKQVGTKEGADPQQVDRQISELKFFAIRWFKCVRCSTCFNLVLIRERTSDRGHYQCDKCFVDRGGAVGTF